MTKTKGSASPTKAAASPKKEAATAVLIVMGYDEHHKPCAARFTGADPDLVAKAAELMDLEVREASSEDLAAVAKKLPVGRLTHPLEVQSTAIQENQWIDARVHEFGL